jgi:hypothetical protein
MLMAYRKHGTFRPSLLSLVQSNTDQTIESTTREAFASLTPTTTLPALKILTQLRGIGPATASLLLSVCAPGDVPFFSDEVFRWCEGDWKRGIKYNVKEYVGVVEKVRELRKRLGVRAEEVERVAWVLGKEGVSLDVGDKEDGGGKAESKDDVQENDVKSAAKKGTKRKAEPKPLVQGTRKSARTKK